MINMTWKKAAPITAATAPLLIIGGVLVRMIGRSESTMTAYTRCAAVIVAALVAIVCIRIFKMIPETIYLLLRIGFCIAAFFAIGQNPVFMTRGLYQALTTYTTVGMTLTALGVFSVVYAINTLITVNGISIFIDQPWGLIAPMMIACAGANIITIR